MSRYIDAEWLEENAKQYSLGYYDYDEWATPLNVLGSAPSIDIVHCRECKHSGVRNDADVECKRHKLIMRLNDFCSYGSRSEKPNNSMERSSE